MIEFALLATMIIRIGIFLFVCNLFVLAYKKLTGDKGGQNKKWKFIVFPDENKDDRE